MGAARNLTKNNPLTLAEFDEFLEVKLVEKGGRYHGRKKKQGKPAWYANTFVDPDKPKVIHGRLTGSELGCASFKIYRAAGSNRPMYQITPMPGCTLSASELEERVMEAAKLIYNRTFTKFPKDTGIKKDGWRGFYHRLASAHDKTLSEKGRAALDLALKMGEIDQEYHACCIKVGIEMEYHPDR